MCKCANEQIPRRARKSAFPGIVHFAHCQKLLACLGSLKRNSPFRPNYKTRKNRDTVTVVNFRHCASVFLLSGILTLLFFIAPKEKIPSTLSVRQATFVEVKSCSGKYLWLEDAFCLRDSGQARSFWQCADELHCKTWCEK